MNKGKCPKCEAPINTIETEHVVIGVPPVNQWHGISYLCPSCKTVLSVQIDPVTLSEDTAKKVALLLKK